MARIWARRNSLKPHALFWVIVLCCSAFAGGQYPPADFAKNPFLLGVPVDLTVPAQPAVFQGTDRKLHVAYELHIRNFSKADLDLKQVDVLGDSGADPLASYSGKELRSSLRIVGGRPASQTLSGGMGAVIFIWLDFKNGDTRKRCGTDSKSLPPPSLATEFRQSMRHPRRSPQKPES